MVEAGSIYSDGYRLYIIRRVDGLVLLYDDCYPTGETVIRCTSTIQFEHDLNGRELWKIGDQTAMEAESVKCPV